MSESGEHSWDWLSIKTTDGAKSEQIAYRRGCWWVEEALVRDEDNRIIGRFMARTLISDAQVPKVLAYHKVKLDEDIASGLHEPLWGRVPK